MPSTPAPAGYSGTPLPKKLGIKPGMVIVLERAPAAIETLLRPLPDGVTFLRDSRRARDLTLWFITTRRELARGPVMARVAAGTTIWACWPKKTSGVPSEIFENDVRDALLPLGLVDYKICAVDATWSAMAFARRKDATHSPLPPPARRHHRQSKTRVP